MSLTAVGVTTADDGRPRKEAIAKALALSTRLTTNICEVLLPSLVALLGARVS